MITTRLIPISPSSASTEELLVEITERVCKSYCTLGPVQPTATVTFTAGTPIVADNNTIVPITALVTVVSPNDKPCGCSHSQVFRETFTIAFNTTGTINLEQGNTVIVQPAYTKCCKSNGVKILTTVTVSLTA